MQVILVRDSAAFAQESGPEIGMRGATLFLHLARGITLAVMGLSATLFALGLGAESSPGFNLVNKSYLIALDIIFFSAFAVAAVFIFVRRSDNWMALAVSAALILYGTTGSVSFYALTAQSGGSSVLSFILQLLYAASTASVPILAYLFPDGKFVPKWTRWLALVWVLWTSASLFLPFLNPYNWPSLYTYSFLALGLGSAILAQVYRYRRVSTAEQKQQTKWILLGFVGVATIFLILQLITILFPVSSYYPFVLFYGAAFTLSQILVPLCISFSILHYRLWDIDLIINRSLIYILASGACIVLLGFTDRIAGELLASLLGTYVSQFVAAAISFLVIGLAFLPLKSRVEEYINRKFYGDKIKLHHALTNIMIEVRPIADLKQLLNTFLDRVCTVLGIAQGAIFLKDEAGSFELVEARRLETSQENLPKILQPDSPSLHLLETGESMVKSKDKTLTWLVPLSVSSSIRAEMEEKRGTNIEDGGTKLIGILALGSRAGGIGYSSEERVLVIGLADQMAASIRLLSTSHA